MANHHATFAGNIPFTAEEEVLWEAEQVAWAAGESSRKAIEIRKERDAKLAKCDWTQVDDAPVEKAVWATYRQALRDVPLQTGFPWTIDWPTI